MVMRTAETRVNILRRQVRVNRKNPALVVLFIYSYMKKYEEKKRRFFARPVHPIFGLTNIKKETKKGNQ